MNSDYNKSIFDLSKEGKVGFSLPSFDEEIDLLEEHKRKIPLDIPSVSEGDVVRHFTNLSIKNFGVDQGFYPLGSCTMKYNPKINEEISKNPKFLNIHPLQDYKSCQGMLEVYYNLEKLLKQITGMDNFSFTPCAGAHGELVGLMMIKEYFLSKKEFNRTKVLIPVSAHGTNPATASLCGFDVINIECLEDGCCNLESLKANLDNSVACIMLTNPSTLGIFEKDILEISKLVKDNNSLMYYDGANLNAILGLVDTKKMGFDVMHINLHKTFSTPHGGGGPGSGPVGCTSLLTPFLPNPRVIYQEHEYKFYRSKLSIGKISSFYGNFTVCLKAYAYILSLGDNIKNVSKLAVLNANYIKKSLEDYYELPIKTNCMHEVIFDGLKNKKAKTLDVAKRLIDYGFHPPTIYFPLLFKETMMIEPTETESLETLDSFIDAMKKIASEDVETIQSAPHTTKIKRLDETRAARFPILKYKDIKKHE